MPYVRVSSPFSAPKIRFGARRKTRLGMGQLSTVASAIQTQEGYYPGSLSYVNNNPGNLMAAGQPGCTATSSGFCSFPTFAQGWQALLNQISLDASRGMSISDFTASYAPASAGNDPVTYAQNIANAVGLSPSDSLSDAISGDTSDDGSSDVSSLSDESGDDTLLYVGLGLVAGAVALFALA
jgi:hypothetical protein